MAGPAADVPLRERAADVGLFVFARIVFDTIAVLLGFYASYTAYRATIDHGILARAMPHPDPYRGLALLFAAITVATFHELGLYGRRASVLNLWELRTTAKGIVLASAAYFAVLFFLRLGLYSRFVGVGGIAASAVLVLVERRALAACYALLLRRGYFGRRVLIYGSGQVGELLMKKIVQSPHIGWRVVGFLDDSARIGSTVACRVAQTGSVIFEAPVLGRTRDLPRIAADVHADELLVSVMPHSTRLREILQTCRERGLRVGIIPNFEDLRVDQLEVEDVSAIPVLRPQLLAPRLLNRIAKRTFDLVLAPLVLLLTAPIWLVAMIWIPLDSPGPIFFAQERIGREGRRFRILKFRTMWRSAPKYAHSPSGDVDPRITRTGRFLRRTGIDELPQLINVIRGDMSIVGPRPEMPFLTDRYGPLQRQRFLVKPGITGLWQISVDRHAEIHENIEYDLYYIAHQSVLLDALILLETMFFTLGLLLRPRWRRERNERSATLPRQGRAVLEPAILLVLDQRRGPESLARWTQWVPAIAAKATDHPVQIVVADENVAVFDDLVARGGGAARSDAHPIDYIPSESRHTVRLLAERARLVITDLPNVATWATNAGTMLVHLDRESQVPADLARADDALARPIVQAPATTPWTPHPEPHPEPSSDSGTSLS